MAPFHSSVLARELTRNVYRKTYVEHGLDGFREPTIGFVKENQDPQKLGRVTVTITVEGKTFTTGWIQIIMPGAGANRGWFFIPEAGDEVLVMFRDGEPLVVGALWGKDKPPDANPDGNNPHRRITSRSGSSVLLDDDGDTIIIEDGTGKGRITFDAKNNKILVEALQGDVCFQAPNGTMTIDVDGNTELDAKQNLEIHCGGEMNLTCPTSIDIKGGDVSISGTAGTNLCGGMAKPAQPSILTAEPVPRPYQGDKNA